MPDTSVAGSFCRVSVETLLSSVIMVMDSPLGENEFAQAEKSRWRDAFNAKRASAGTHRNSRSAATMPNL
jgi:hypothetical protein